MFKGTLERSIRLSTLENINEDYVLQNARKQLCCRMDSDTQKEIVWITSVDFEHLKNNEGSLNADGSVDIVTRFVAVLRRIYPGDEVEGMVVRKNAGERALMNYENIDIVIEDSETDFLIRVNEKIKVRICHVKYSTLPTGHVGIEARAIIEY